VFDADNEISIWSTGGMYLQGKIETLREKPVPVTLFPPQIPRELSWDKPRPGW